MRSILAAVLVLAPVTVFAGHRGGGSGGGGGGGGALSHVSSGLGHASTSSGGSRGSSSTTTVIVTDRSPRYVEGGPTVIVRDRAYQPEEAVPTAPAHFTAYAGVQKVHDSNESFSLELAIEDRWARIGGQYTRFSEDQGAGMPALTLSMPSFTLGVRVDGGGATKAFVEGGVVGAKTHNDPTMDTSWVGVLGGLRLESKIAPSTSLVGTAQLMVFGQEVRAGAFTAGVRVGPLQASLRVVDFNVGPALWGPEVGVRF